MAETLQCHIHVDVQNWELEKIRGNVCVNELPLNKYTDGNYYCLFHLPTKDKDIFKFNEILQSRLNLIRNQIDETEDLDEKENTLELTKARLALGDEHVFKFGNGADDSYQQRKPTYDFSYVFFPSLANFIDYEFKARVNFSSTTFSEAAHFSLGKFTKYADFGSAKFLEGANFSSTIFKDDASFISTKFLSGCNFSNSIFSNKAYFRHASFAQGILFSSAEFCDVTIFEEANFSGYTSFDLAQFNELVSFRRANFLSDAQFNLTNFSSDLDFVGTVFAQNVQFISSKFLETSKVSFNKTKFQNTVNFRSAIFAGYITFEGDLGENMLFGEIGKTKAVLDLQNVRLEKPERISFYRVQLLPNWFVNIDSRKIIFIDVVWENLSNNFANENLFAELKNLEKRGMEKPKQLFRIACRQLAENAENNNRYEEASNFRRMAMETEWFERKEKLKAKPENFLDFFRQVRDISIYGLYRFSSSYGERWGRAFIWFVLICPVFALLFYLFGTFEKAVLQTFGDYLAYSLQVMTLQRPEPKPLGFWTNIIYTMELVLAPVQLALLALAIRRKFMR